MDPATIDALARLYQLAGAGPVVVAAIVFGFLESREWRRAYAERSQAMTGLADAITSVTASTLVLAKERTLEPKVADG